jgi:hypothetical protein
MTGRGRKTGAAAKIRELHAQGLQPTAIALKAEVKPRYVRDVLSEVRTSPRHHGPRQLSVFQRQKTDKTVCGRNVLNRETGKVESCQSPRFESGGEKMGCCRDCYDRTRPIGSVTNSYVRIGK